MFIFLVVVPTRKRGVDFGFAFCYNLGMVILDKKFIYLAYNGKIIKYRGIDLDVRISSWVSGKPEYKEWRKKVLARDGNKCVRCGADKNLHVHHIRPKALLIIEMLSKGLKDIKKYSPLWDINNGMTVCHKCHRAIEIPNQYSVSERVCLIFK